MSIVAKHIIYKKHGDPSKVLQLEDISLADNSLQNSEVLVRWLAAPINPSDLYQIVGNFGIQPKLPAIGGNEGCGIVEQIGPGVSSVRPGDAVLPNGLCGLGTWRTHGIHDEKLLFKLDDAEGGLCHNIVGDCSLVAASILINPPTAYRMLKDFVDLQRGDFVVQNGANSAVGRYVIQLCRIWGYKSVNVIRNRPDVEGLKRDLKQLGADQVYTQEEFVDIANDELKGVRLALDCVGGQPGAALTLALEEGGCFVSYGSMSGEESPKVARKDIQVKSFAIAKWYNQRGNEKERRQLYAEIGKLIQSGQLKGPDFTQRKITDFKEAIRASQEKSNTKQIFIFGYNNTSRSMKSR